MELPPLTGVDPPPFEWSDLFDFSIDDHLFANFDVDPEPQPQPAPPAPIPSPSAQTSSSSGDRVRKRDPRMVCENFLAGRVPCACPELDAKMEEEEQEVGPGKKRVRVGRTPGVARCQVPGCGVDISELKGYHKRHRVCLGCANAGSVVFDGESKRYCQQCGKFHLLPDFDEGKRSCRRKLERHNNRRRRKPADSRGSVEKDLQEELQTEDVSSDGEAGKENTWSGSQIAEKEDSKDGTLSNLCSALESQNIETESNMTFIQSDKVLDTFKQDHSRPSSDNRSAYSSACPTGRISFKLYDWNPAEFPRRLRHQIFQWLASMPVELEGYIRPGCTIVTAFVSMPQFKWIKLFEDPVSYIQSSTGPGGMLSGRGTALVYFNDIVFRVLGDGASVMKVKVAVRTPKLHYVYPPCFVAGKPMDLIACGSNLLQPKFRSLISFAGTYLAHDYYVAFPRAKDSDESVDVEHQFCRIYVGKTEPSFFGPAFIEVENECGLSNFIPVLIGDENICAEITKIHQKYDSCLCKKKREPIPSGSPGPCEASCSRQTAFSDFMLDVAWLLKWPCAEKLHHVTTSCQIQRFNCLLSFLISNRSTSILRRILETLQSVLDEIESTNLATGMDCNRRLLMEYINRARDLLHEPAHKEKLISSLVGDPLAKADNILESIPDGNDSLSINCADSQVLEKSADMKCKHIECSDSHGKEETQTLLNQAVARNFNDDRQLQRTSCSLMSSKRFIISRPFIYIVAAVAVCFGVCAVAFHPQKVSRFAVTIRRCMFDNSSNSYD